MAEKTINTKIKQRIDSAANWELKNPILLDGEMGFIKETGSYKIGDGITPWNNLGLTYDKAKLDSLTATGYNILDNSDFTNPVNQRGTAIYYTAGYTIDRWVLNAGALNVADRYIAGGLADGTVYLYQPLLIPKQLGKVLTAAARINGADYALTLDTSKSHTEQTNKVAFTGGRLECSWNKTNGMFYFRITSLTSAAVVIDWAKLEVGSVSTPYVPKGYGAELAECQRYYQRFTDMHLSGIVYCPNGDMRGMGFVLPVPMRIAPSVSNAVTADVFAFVVSDARSDINQSISYKSFETNQELIAVRNLQFTNAGLYSGVAAITVKFTLVELSAEL